MTTLNDVPVIDAHIHLWDARVTPRKLSPLVRLLGFSPRLIELAARAAFPQSAFDFVGTPEHLIAPYLPGSWRRDHAPVSVRGFVHIQAGWEGDPVDETRWLEELCGSDLLGIVGHADLGAADLSETLNAHRAASARFVGVRDMLATVGGSRIMSWSEPRRMADRAWRRGFELLGERGLTFDAWCYGPQLGELHELLRTCPGTRVVLDHAGTPLLPPDGSAAERERVVREWYADLERLAEHQQLSVKLSGLGMPVVGYGWHQRAAPPSVAEVSDALGPHVEKLLACFGAQRLIAGSNFPMDKVAWPWPTWFRALDELTAGLGADERRAVFHDNALRFYGLE